MIHTIKFESYSVDERLDDILDKISNYGIDHLTFLEIEFLESYKDSKETETHNRIKNIEDEVVFVDDIGIFRFEFKETHELLNEIHIFGTFYVPDMIIGGGKKLNGCLDGRITLYGNGTIALEFESGKYDIFEFCTGIEYELDAFVDYIVAEILEKYKSKN